MPQTGIEGIEKAVSSLRNIKTALDRMMESLDFVKVSGLLYRRPGIGGVESLVEWNLFGKPINNIACDFGLRNPQALAFAEECLILYGGPVYGHRKPETFSFNARCQVGMHCSWSPRSSLRLSDYGDRLEPLIERAAADIGMLIRKRAAAITSLEQFCDLLIRNDDWMPWDHSHGALRAAEYAYLASRLGIKPETILRNLEPYARVNIRSGVSRTIDAGIYLQNIMRHLEITSAESVGVTIGKDGA